MIRDETAAFAEDFWLVGNIIPTRLYNRIFVHHLPLLSEVFGNSVGQHVTFGNLLKLGKSYYLSYP